MSEENTSTNSGSQGAPSSFSNQSGFKKKKAKKDSLGGVLMMIAMLGIVASILSIVFSVLFLGSN